MERSIYWIIMVLFNFPIGGPWRGTLRQWTGFYRLVPLPEHA